MGLLILEEVKEHREGDDPGATLKHPLFSDPQRRERARQMILQKRGGGHGGRADRR